MEILEELAFLCEAVYGQPGIDEFWRKESEQAEREGMVCESELYKDQERLAKQFQSTAP